MNAIEEELQSTVEFQAGQITELKKRIDLLEKRMEKLEKEKKST